MLRAQFLMTLEPSPKLLIGQFELLKDDEILGVWPATSGTRGNQSKNDYWARGRGPIPPSIPGKRDYTFNVKGRYSLATKGIEGLAYPIAPDPIISLDGTERRSEVMIHRDANVPGSAGCIVLGIDEAAYKAFNALIWSVGKDESAVPLLVAYKSREELKAA